MSEEMSALIDAVHSLKQEESLLKDYIYPVVLAFFSALMGGLIGYRAILTQRRIDDEKAKIDATNKLVLEAVDCFHSLQGIKGNYSGKLTDDPIQRLFCVPPILMTYRLSNPDFSNLAYLAKGLKERTQKLQANGQQTQPPSENKFTTFANIGRIKIVFSNYDTLLEIWKTRNQLIPPIISTVVVSTINGTVTSLQDLIKLVGHDKLALAVDLTEKAISHTDEYLLDFAKLLSEFPPIAEALIDKDVLKTYGNVMKVEINSGSTPLLTKSPVNEAQLAAILDPMASQR